MKEKKTTNFTDEEIQKMIESGELGSMTECAYGKAIADDESDKLKSKNFHSK